jgi:copper chaperone CopZ
MKKGKIINVVLVTASVALLVVFAFFVRLRPTADYVAELRTTGMTCGGCSATVEKALHGKSGVASVEVDVAGGWVVIGYDSKKIRPEELAATVIRQGYASRIERLSTVEQFRSMTGRFPGEGTAKKIGCICGDRK